MEQFTQNITSFPTLVYTVLLGVVLVYWVLSVLGAVDMDTLDIDVDIDADASALSALTGFMLTFGLSGVPISVIVSLWSLYAWLLCYFAVEYFVAFLPGEILQLMGGIAVLLGSFFISVPLIAQTIKPLKGLFKNHTAVKKEDLVSSICTVTTMDVSEDFGQGELHDGQAGMILAIRAPSPNEIKKGDKVVIIAYNENKSTFDVVTEEEFRM